MKICIIATLCAVFVVGGTLEINWHSSEMNLAHTAKMIDGKKISIVEAPWHVYTMAEYERSSGMATCSGSIISSNWVVTAAHCACPAEPLTVKKFVLAGSDFYSEVNTFWARYNNDTEGFRYIIDESVCHPYYRVDSLGPHDIGLSRVADPFKFDETRQPIPLNIQDRASLAESRAIAFGWDDSEENPNEPGQVLTCATMKITPKQKCDDFRSTIYDSSSPPHGEICAESISGKPCSGDSGGSLVINGTLVALYTWYYTECGPKYPFGFVDIAYHLDWILEKTSLSLTDRDTVNSGLLVPRSSSHQHGKRAKSLRFEERVAVESPFKQEERNTLNVGSSLPQSSSSSSSLRPFSRVWKSGTASSRLRSFIRNLKQKWRKWLAIGYKTSSRIYNFLFPPTKKSP